MWPPFRLTTSCKQTLAFVTFARKCSAAQGPHSAVVPHAFWRLVSKSCDECKGSFVRGCETKRWSHWTCSSLGTIFQPMRINSVPDVKCFCNIKNVLRAQSMLWHFVRHPVYDKSGSHCDIHEDASHSTNVMDPLYTNGVTVLSHTPTSRRYREVTPPNFSLFPQLKMKLYVRRFYTVTDIGNIVTS